MFFSPSCVRLSQNNRLTSHHTVFNVQESKLMTFAHLFCAHFNFNFKFTGRTRAFKSAEASGPLSLGSSLFHICAYIMSLSKPLHITEQRHLYHR